MSGADSHHEQKYLASLEPAGDPPEPDSPEEWVEWYEGENARLRHLVVYLRTLLELQPHSIINYAEEEMEDAWDIVIVESLKQGVGE